MVYTIMELLESGLTQDDIVKDYYLNISKADIKASLHYAAALIKDQKYIPFEQAI